MTSLLPTPEQVFLDNNGAILAAGTVATYIPNTFTPKATWQDAAQAVMNTNPIVLDSAGRAIIYGSGAYRFVVSDAVGNVIYDENTASTLDESAISTVMLPVTSAATLATARRLLGVDDAITSAVTGVTTLPGPRGPTGPTGPTGVTGPTGPSSGAGGFDSQFFGASGTWTKPASGHIAVIQAWGAGGAGTDASFGGGGGGGGYVCVAVLLSTLPSTVAVTVGGGGGFVSGNAGPGANGGNTTFGSFLTMKGGAGGALSGGPVTGASGYLSAVSGLNLLWGSYDYSGAMTAQDGFGNPYFASPFSGTAGGANTATTPAVFGGAGGGFPVGTSGAVPGGGGSVNGGSGGSGQVIVTVF